ncbi:MAG: co-chaperone GroES [Chlamydiae bacterium]|nr:co-chaperone GroES [Chlamydiota bacterium]
MSAQRIKPLGNRVLVRRSQVKVTKGGIILPDSAQEKPKQGQVVAVGPGKMEEDGRIKKMHVQVGDTVLFGSYAGTEVKNTSQEEEYLIMSEEDILGVLCEISSNI